MPPLSSGTPNPGTPSLYKEARERPVRGDRILAIPGPPGTPSNPETESWSTTPLLFSHR